MKIEVLCQPEKENAPSCPDTGKMTLTNKKLPMMMVMVTVLMLMDIQSLPVNKDLILILQFWKIMSPKRPKL